MMVLFFTGLAFTMLSFFYKIVVWKRDNHIDDCYDFITMILLPAMMLMIERLLGSVDVDVDVNVDVDVDVNVDVEVDVDVDVDNDVEVDVDDDVDDRETAGKCRCRCQCQC